MKKALSLLVLALVSTANAAVEYEYVRVPIARLTPDWVKQTQFNRDHKYDDTYAFGYIPKTIFKTIKGNDLVVLNAKAWAKQDHDAKTLRAIPAPTGEIKAEDYHTYATLTTELKAIAQQNAKLVTLASAGKSVEGRDLWYVRLSNPTPQVFGKPKLLFVSSMHGDEVTGKEMMVYLIREMLAKYGTDAKITSLLDYAEIYIMPSMNPDGTEHETRFNANGVDLNRDFPLLNEDVFGGNHAVEVKALMELHKANHFVLAMNFHGGSLCVNIPWDSKPNTATSMFGDDTVMQKLARAYADLNVPMSKVNGGSFKNGVTYGYEWYQVLGGMQDWSSHFLGSIHATTELSTTKWPTATQLPTFWKDNRDALVTYLEGGIRGIHLKITDEDGKFLTAKVGVSSSTRTVEFTGYAHRPTPAGTYDVTVTAPGYLSQKVNLTSEVFAGKYFEVEMKKAR